MFLFSYNFSKVPPSLKAMYGKDLIAIKNYNDDDFDHDLAIGDDGSIPRDL